jgi:hypothetical protein
MANKTGIGSYPPDGETERVPGGGETSEQNKGGTTADRDRIEKNLERYREELAEDAPASNSPEDNP